MKVFSHQHLNKIARKLQKPRYIRYGQYKRIEVTDIQLLARFVALSALMILLGLILWAIMRKPVKLIYVDNQLNKCEKAGGNYTLFKSNYNGKYYEYCEIKDKYINLIEK